MQKNLRQKKLLSLIKAKPFATQAELRDSLERAGVPATQSSLSRDMEELGIVKHRGHYTVPKSNGAAARAAESRPVRRQPGDSQNRTGTGFGGCRGD